MRRRWQLQVGGHGDEGAAWSRAHAGCCQQREIARLSWHAPHSLLCLDCSPLHACCSCMLAPTAHRSASLPTVLPAGRRFRDTVLGLGGGRAPQLVFQVSAARMSLFTLPCIALRCLFVFD